MEYGLIDFSGTRETILEEILLSLARYEATCPASGYSFTVEGYLKETLSYLDIHETDTDEKGKCPLYRVYTEVVDAPGQVLVVGDSLRDWGNKAVISPPLKDLITYIYISSKFSKDLEWGLIGIATPGWVLLFDEDSVYLNRSEISRNVKVVYCPSDELFLDRLSPEVDTHISLEMIMRMLLENVPPRQDREDPSLYTEDL